MGERTLRRNNNIILSAQQLDHNASMARDLNKQESNRLRLHKGNIDGHQNTNLNSLDYEMRRLKNELKEITHNSGTITRQTMPSKAGVDTTRLRRKTSKRMAPDRNARTDKDSVLSRNAGIDGNTEPQSLQNLGPQSRRKSVSLPTLPSMSSTVILSPRHPPQLTSRSDNPKIEESVEESFSSHVSSKPKKETRRKHSRRKLSLEATASPSQTKGRRISVSVTDTNGDTMFQPVSSRGTAKEDSASFANLNLGAVKDRIQTRLSQPGPGNNDQSINDDDIDPDIAPYMHVPPDGLPRTVFLLPPLTDLLQEAKNARYIRRPKKPLQEADMDDPDRELGIDEIFNQKR